MVYITPTGCNNKCAVVLCGQLGSSAVVAGFLVSWFCGDMHDEPPETEKAAILFCDNLISHLEGIFKNCCTHTHTQILFLNSISCTLFLIRFREGVGVCKSLCKVVGKLQGVVTMAMPYFRDL